MGETLTETTLRNLRECRIPSLSHLNYITRDDPTGKRPSNLRYLAEHLAKKLKDREVDPEGLCVITLDIVADFQQQLAEYRQDTGRPPLQDLDFAVFGALYGSIREIARDIFPPQFADRVRDVLIQVQRDYYSGKYKVQEPVQRR